MIDQSNYYARKRPRGPKYYACPFCHGRAILLVDVDNERAAEVDDDGNVQYFCLDCNKTFSVDAHGNVV